MSPSANKLCRLCLINRSEINLKSNVDQLDLRDRTNYDQAVVASNENVGNIPKTGVKYASLLNDSLFFHYAENLIFDAMHDFNEGVGPFSIQLVLNAFETIYPEYGINATLLNQRINSFQYSYYDLSNKPSARFTGENIRRKGNYSTRQRAGQNFCLLNNFAMLIGDKVHKDNVHFAIILTLRHIVDIIFSPVLTNDHTVLLEVLIMRYFEEFRLAFHDVQGINKMHHMVHYPQIIRSQGPPMLY